MLQSVRRTRLLAALVVLWAFALQACSNTVQTGAIYYPDAGKKDGGGLLGDIKYGDGGGPGAPGPDGSEGADAGGEAIVKRQIILLLADDKLFMAPNGPESIKPVGVQVIDYAVGGPAAGVPVFWEITGNQGPNAPGAGAFDNQNVFTDDAGKAQNVFRANKTPLNNYKVKVT